MKELATVWSVTLLALDVMHAGLAMDGHPAGAGEDTVLVTLMVTDEEELVGKATATSFQDPPGCIVDVDGARLTLNAVGGKSCKPTIDLDVECGLNETKVLPTYHYDILFPSYFLHNTKTFSLPEMNFLHISFIMAQ